MVTLPSECRQREVTEVAFHSQTKRGERDRETVTLPSECRQRTGLWWFNVLGTVTVLMYSLGYSVLVVAGTSVGFVKHFNASQKCGKFGTALKYGMGGVLLLLGFYLLYLGFRARQLSLDGAVIL